MPYLRLSWGKLIPGSWDQFEKHYQEQVAPKVNTVKGLQIRALLPSTDTPDEGLSLTMWETPEDMSNYERSGEIRANVSQVEHLFTGEYWIKHFEIVSAAKPE
jgi:heme-degrading monooxygenase HmoA